MMNEKPMCYARGCSGPSCSSVLRSPFLRVMNPGQRSIGQFWEGFVLCECGLREVLHEKGETVESIEVMEKGGKRGPLTDRMGIAMKLIETLRSRTEALKVADMAKLFGVTPQHIYRMAANGSIPSFRISGSVRFDPDEVAAWLAEKKGPAAASRRIGSARVAA